MDLDDQFRRYFGTADLDSVAAATLSAGIERMTIDFGLEKDPQGGSLYGPCFTCWMPLRIWMLRSQTIRIVITPATSWT